MRYDFVNPFVSSAREILEEVLSGRIDAGKIRSELGWSARHDLASGLEATVRWYLDNGDWCAAIQHERYQRQRLGLGG